MASDTPENSRGIYSTFWDQYVQNWEEKNKRFGTKRRWPGDEWGDSEHWERVFRRLFVGAGVSGWTRAVEIGPGSGKYTEKVLAGSSATVRAYDVSEKFLSVCGTRLKRAIDESRLNLRLLALQAPDELYADLEAAGWTRRVDGFYSIDAMVHV